MNLSYTAEDMHAEAAELEERERALEAQNDMGDEDEDGPEPEVSEEEHEMADREDFYLDSYMESMLSGEGFMGGDC